MDDMVLVPRDLARKALIDLMGELSEDCWAAGWMNGIERDLWMLMNGTSESTVWQLEKRWVPTLITYARMLDEWPSPDESVDWVSLSYMEERFGPLPPA